VRARAKASPVLANNVNLDYILDERLRELCIEEMRMLTLMRTDKLVERVTKYNPFYAVNMKPNFNLWAIPCGEMDRNRSA
jgi:starch-binding outer membrane protein, SusD/RagB family